MNVKESLAKKLLRGGVWATVGKVIFTIATLAWNSLLTRVLNTDDVGVFYLIASIVVFGELVVLGGMNQAAMRLIASKSAVQQEVRSVIKGSFLLMVVFASFGSLIYFFVLAPFLSQEIFYSPLISQLSEYTVAWFVLRAVQTYIAFIFRGFHRVGIAAFVEGATPAIFITIALTYLYIFPFEKDITTVFAVVTGALVCNVLFALMLIRNSYIKTKKEKTFSFFEPLRIGLPLSVLAISSVGMNEAHIWIAGALVSHFDVALYGAASRLAKFVQMPLLIINGVIPSTIAHLHALEDKGKIEKTLQAVASITALPSILIAIVVYSFSDQILSLVFGAAYAAGADILIILIFGQVLSVLVGSPGVLMAMSDHQKMLMTVGMLSGLSGIAMSIYLSGFFGIVGIAIGAVTGKILQNIILWLYCLKILGIRTHPSFSSIKDINVLIKNRRKILK